MSTNSKKLFFTTDKRTDSLGRRQFVLTWVADSYRTELGKDGKPVGYRRGQYFFANPATYIAQGWTPQSEVLP